MEVTFMEEALYFASLDNDDLLYLKEQMEVDEDVNAFCKTLALPAERMRCGLRNLNKDIVDSSPASIPLPLPVEPKPKSGIMQQDLLKSVLGVKPKKPKVSRRFDGSNSISSTQVILSINYDSNQEKQKDVLPAKPNDTEKETKVDNPIKISIAAYESSDDED
uniref:Uncharacterized protein n=1 Tax=Solanum lycopersicum TaxID=4081 RepID=A0A3Q7GZ87_SOLLC